MENDVQHCDEVHGCEHGGDSIETVCVLFLVRGDAQQHEGDAQLDGDDCGAIEHFEEKEELQGLV